MVELYMLEISGKFEKDLAKIESSGPLPLDINENR